MAARPKRASGRKRPQEAASEGSIMHTTMGLALLTLSSVLGFGAATALQAPQGKEAVVAAGAPPKLADMLKGYVGRDCWISLREHQMLEISFDPQVHPGTEWKRKIELVGQDFLKLDGDQQLIPFGFLGPIQMKKP